MNGLNKILIIVAILLVFTQGGLLFLLLGRSETSLMMKSMYSSPSFYDEAYFQAGDGFSVEKQAYGAIVPHHLFVKSKIAAFFRGLKKFDYETVILIGPNHFHAGLNEVQTSRAVWLTPYGVVKPDLDIIDRLVESDFAAVEEQSFPREHAITGLVAFVKKSLPRARIVPIILKEKTEAAAVERLAKFISGEIDPDKSLVIASVDFSHEQNALVSNLQDETSINAITQFDFLNVYDLKLDSPAAIFFTLKYLDLIGAKKSTVFSHTNSSELLGRPDLPGTSHFIVGFSK